MRNRLGAGNTPVSLSAHLTTGRISNLSFNDVVFVGRGDRGSNAAYLGFVTDCHRTDDDSVLVGFVGRTTLRCAVLFRPEGGLSQSAYCGCDDRHNVVRLGIRDTHFLENGSDSLHSCIHVGGR